MQQQQPASVPLSFIITSQHTANGHSLLPQAL